MQQIVIVLFSFWPCGMQRVELAARTSSSPMCLFMVQQIGLKCSLSHVSQLLSSGLIDFCQPAPRILAKIISGVFPIRACWDFCVPLCLGDASASVCVGSMK